MDPSPRTTHAHNGFDSISEPDRRTAPAFMRRKKARRTRTVLVVSLIGAFLLLWGWKSSGITIIPRSRSRFSAIPLLSQPQTTITPSGLQEQPESPLLPPPPPPPPPPLPNNTQGLQKTDATFHLIVPASEPNPEFCKTILSSFILSYPPATLVNYGKKFDGEGWDKGSHAGKIRGVYDFLNNKEQVKDDDLVLVVDGYDLWFQLPPEIIIKQYHELNSEANERLRGRYGTVANGDPRDGTASRIQKYKQKVIFGADKICWPNSKEDPACAAIPYSTLKKDIYGPDTDKDPEAFHNRPRFLNSGAVIGPVADVRAIYGYAVQKVEKDEKGTLGDQFVLAEIFGEQEYQRETLRRSNQGTGGRFYDWVSNALGTSDSPSPLSSNITINNMTTIPGRRYEYGIGIDYGSRLFQTMTHSADDVTFITYNSSDSIQSSHPGAHAPLYVPSDLLTADLPFSYVSPGNHTPSPPDPSSPAPLLLPYAPALDDLPPPEKQPTWLTIPLATNTYSASIPPILHVNGDKTLLETWWPRLWFHPYARALLRQFIRSTQTTTADRAAAAGGQGWWDRRGGRGGVWTDKGSWMGWSEICKGFEEQVFNDGKGVWGKEKDGVKDGGRMVNSFGTTIIEGDA